MENLRRLFDKLAVAPTEHDALVKSTTKIFFKFCGLLRNPNFNSVQNCSLIKSRSLGVSGFEILRFFHLYSFQPNSHTLNSNSFFCLLSREEIDCTKMKRNNSTSLKWIKLPKNKDTNYECPLMYDEKLPKRWS